MLSNLFALAALASTSFDLALGQPSHSSNMGRSHDALAKRVSGDLHLYKRFSDARWTFYDVGLGACGQSNVASDFIVALNSAQFGGGYPSPNCFKKITMSYGGKTTQATIMDECPGCPFGGLDLSRGLFDYFASESMGVLSGTWFFGDSGDSSGDQTTSSKKHTTSQYTSTPTFTHKSTHTPTSDATTSSSKTTQTSSTDSATQTSSADLAIGTTVTTANGSIEAAFVAFLDLTGFLVAAGGLV